MMSTTTMTSGRDETDVNMIEQGLKSRNLLLQRNDLRTLESRRLCLESCKKLKVRGTEVPCSRVVLKSDTIRKQKTLDIHPRRDVQLGVPVKKSINKFYKRVTLKRIAEQADAMCKEIQTGDQFWLHNPVWKKNGQAPEDLGDSGLLSTTLRSE